jgi:hypothetical protein
LTFHKAVLRYVDVYLKMSYLGHLMYYYIIFVTFCALGRPCDHKGKTYQDGESFKDDCNTCNCNDGIAACTLMACRKLSLFS